MRTYLNYIIAVPAALMGWLHEAEAQSVTNEVFTQNAICRMNNCVNPLFPGLNDLAQLEDMTWSCDSNARVRGYTDFCQGALYYDPAVPSPNSSQLLSDVVKGQDDVAATMFFYHLSGLGYEAWDHKKPSEASDECVKAVWKMVCYTYFPKANPGCLVGQESNYQRPCSGSCQNYLQKCNVECCDESPQCVFSHTQATNKPGVTLLQTGYVDQPGPSALCTGSNSKRGARFPLVLLLGILGFHLAVGGSSGAASTPKETPHQSKAGKGIGQWLFYGALIVCALLLHGCDIDIPKHHVGNWRQKADYLVTFEFIQPGQTPKAAVLNSCNVPGLPATLQCSGHGYCKEWNSLSTSKNPLSFCVCDKGWADPECRTQRKSQTVAFVASVFGGLFGADYFYLGFPCWGILKLLTLGGLGFWWLLDLVRTGTGPIYAANYRVANDLPHWVFVLVTISLFAVIGFGVSLESYFKHRARKRNELLRLKEGEEGRKARDVRREDLEGPRYELPGRPPARDFVHAFQGYGAALPRNIPNAGAPYMAGATAA